MTDIESDKRDFIEEGKNKKYISHIEDISESHPNYDIEIYFKGNNRDKDEFYMLLKKYNMGIVSFKNNDSWLGVLLSKKEREILFLNHKQNI